MKRIYTLSICCSMLFLMSGCSVFISTPRVAHVPVTGLNNQLSEYVIRLDNLTEADLDIRLNDHYAIRLDLQWLGDDQDAMNPEIQMMRDDASPQFSPWIMCKYRY